MTMLHDSADLDLSVATEPARFRAPTIEAALADARAELGPDVEILEANRIRRGGVGGFFATELGVEITVRIASVDDAYDRSHDASQGPRPATNADPEYIDTTELPRSLPSLVATGEPQFYDQQRVERTGEPAPTTDIDELVRAITERERSAHQPVDRTFAAHLARELARPAEPADAVTRPIVRPLPARHEPSVTSAHPTVADVRARVAESRAESRPTPLSTEDTGHDTTVIASGPGAEREATSPPSGRTEVTDASASPTTADAPEHAAPNPTTAGAVDAAPNPTTADAAEHATPNPTTADAAEHAAPSTADAPEHATPNPTTASGASPVPVARRRSTSSRDPMRRQVDLAAGAVGRLLEQLSDVAPVEGSRMRSLSKLTVKVTAPDGTVIEMAAEIGESGHG